MTKSIKEAQDDKLSLEEPEIVEAVKKLESAQTKLEASEFDLKNLKPAIDAGIKAGLPTLITEIFEIFKRISEFMN